MLVTGGAGFIGSNFIRHMLAVDRGIRIINLDALTYAGSLDNLAALPDAGRHLLIEGDITDAALVDRIFAEHCVDTVVHFAAESHVDRSIAGPDAFVRTNVVGTYTLLEAARRHWLPTKGRVTEKQAHFRFHHISTDEVYGSLDPDTPAFTEASPYAPNSPYSATKAGSDHLVRAYHRTYGLPVTTSNCSNNYGPYQHGEKFIPTVIRACLAGRPIPVYGDGGNVRDWLYIEDHCRGIDRVIRYGMPGEVYNIGGGDEHTNIGIARRICALMDTYRPEGRPHERLISFVPDRPGHDWRYAIDTGKIRRALGWHPTVGFEAGIRRTIEWYLEKEKT